MRKHSRIEERIASREGEERLSLLYESPEEAKSRITALLSGFHARFGGEAEALFSVPGRVELGGNHTDHQHGCVLCASIGQDLLAAAKQREDGLVRIASEGQPPIEFPLCDLQTPMPNQIGTATALARGALAYFKEHGFSLGGFDAYVTSNVPQGAGLSSSAAFSVLIGKIESTLYHGDSIDAVMLSKAARYAENRYFGKPCGLMDQMACSVGGAVYIDFRDSENPLYQSIPTSLSELSLAAVLVLTGGSHADLTEEYASVPREMESVAHAFNKSVLREVDEAEFYRTLPSLRGRVGDRALLRAIHFFSETGRAKEEADALLQKEAERFLSLVNASGESSFTLLQNCFPKAETERGVALALALTKRFLHGEGACRVHGGGFAGSVLAVLPEKREGEYRLDMERIFGTGSCIPLRIRPVGAVCLFHSNAIDSQSEE